LLKGQKQKNVRKRNEKMKGLLIALGIKATLIYVNGPANSPILNRMAISVISLKEQFTPTGD